MSVSAKVGALDIPIQSGGVKERLSDPLVDKLLDFSAFVIKNALDAKLHDLLGTSTDAVPEKNRFPYNPLEPRGKHRVLSPPALFVWWNGRSKISKHSSIYYMRERELRLLYVFPELPQTAELERRAGLLNAVDACLHQASFWMGHDEYGSGASIRSQLGYPCMTEWEYLGGEPGRFGIDEGAGVERRISRHSGRDYPALKGYFALYERVTPKDLTDDDLLQDGQFTINAGETEDTVETLTMVLGSPDGSEDDL